MEYLDLIDYDLSAENTEKIDEIVTELKDLPYVMAVYLFGSHVKKTSTPFSDIDIGVILRDPASQWQYEKVGEYSSEIIDIEIFNRLSINIQNAIVSEGILLFCRDEEYLSEIIKETVAKYFHYNPNANENSQHMDKQTKKLIDKRERLLYAVAKIKQYYTEYAVIARDGIPKREDLIPYHAISMIMFAIINLTFEIGEEVINIKKFTTPKSHRDIFKILCNEGIISEELKNKMSRLIYYRNHFAHRYSEIEEADLFAIADDMDAILEYVETLSDVGLSKK